MCNKLEDLTYIFIYLSRKESKVLSINLFIHQSQTTQDFSWISIITIQQNYSDTERQIKLMPSDILRAVCSKVNQLVGSKLWLFTLFVLCEFTSTVLLCLLFYKRRRLTESWTMTGDCRILEWTCKWRTLSQMKCKNSWWELILSHFTYSVTKPHLRRTTRTRTTTRNSVWLLEAQKLQLFLSNVCCRRVFLMWPHGQWWLTDKTTRGKDSTLVKYFGNNSCFEKLGVACNKNPIVRSKLEWNCNIN